MSLVLQQILSTRYPTRILHFFKNNILDLHLQVSLCYFHITLDIEIPSAVTELCGDKQTFALLIFLPKVMRKRINK